MTSRCSRYLMFQAMHHLLNCLCDCIQQSLRGGRAGAGIQRERVRIGANTSAAQLLK